MNTAHPFDTSAPRQSDTVHGRHPAQERVGEVNAVQAEVYLDSQTSHAHGDCATSLPEALASNPLEPNYTLPPSTSGHSSEFGDAARPCTENHEEVLTQASHVSGYTADADACLSAPESGQAATNSMDVESAADHRRSSVAPSSAHGCASVHQTDAASNPLSPMSSQGCEPVDAGSCAHQMADPLEAQQSIMVGGVPTYVYDSDASSAVAQPQGLVRSGESQIVLNNGEIAPGLHRLPLVGLLCNYMAPLAIFIIALLVNVGKAMSSPADIFKNLSEFFGVFGSFLVVFIIIAVQFIVKYYSFMWGITPDGLRIKEGIVVKKDMTIPFSKIHSLHLTEPILMRALGFVTVKIDTGASGFQAAHRITALHRNEAEALQRDIFKYKQILAEVGQSAQKGPQNSGELLASDTPLDLQAVDAVTRDLVEQARNIHRQELTLAHDMPHEPSRLTQEVVKFDQRVRGLFAGRTITDTDVIAQRSLSLSELVWSSLLNIRMGAGVSVILATISFTAGLAGVQQWIDSQASYFERSVEASVSSGGTMATGTYWVYVPIIILVVGVLLSILAVVISVVQHMVSHANFSVSRTRSRINITAGLVTRNSYAIATERVQAFIIRQSLLQRLFKYATLQVVLLQGQDETSKKGSQEFKQDGKETVYPCIRLHEIPKFLDEYLPEYAAVYQANYAMTTLPPKALSRSLKRASYWGMIAAACMAVGAVCILSLTGNTPIFPTHMSPVIITALLSFAIVFVLQVLPRYLAWKQTKVGRTNDVLCVHKGIFEVTRTMVYREKLQEIEINQNPFQVRLELARVRYRTAGHSGMSSGFVYDVPLACAYDIYEWLRPQKHNDRLVSFALSQVGMQTTFTPQQTYTHAR